MSEELTAKQAAFVEEYLIDRNATQAAIRAGYSQDTARQMGSENLAKPYIAKNIQEAMDLRSERTKIDSDYVFNTILDTIERCKQSRPVLDKKGNPVYTENAEGDVVPAYEFDSAAVLRGAELLGKHLKLFSDRTEITGADGGKIEMEVNINLIKPNSCG